MSLSPAQAEYESGGVSQRTLARKYGVTQRTVGRALRGEMWKHVGATR